MGHNINLSLKTCLLLVGGRLLDIFNWYRYLRFLCFGGGLAASFNPINAAYRLIFIYVKSNSRGLAT
jgi:hypothetical protein